MLSVKCSYVECSYAESQYAECHYVECSYAERQYAECHYVECCYAKCHLPPIIIFARKAGVYPSKIARGVATISHFLPSLINAGKAKA